MLNVETLNQFGIDYTAGLERFMNDAELLEAVLTAFIDEDMLERATVAYEAKDNARLLAVVHEAKGACGSAGLDRVYIAASALVALLRSPSFTEDERTEHFDRFAAAYTTARQGIKAALGQ